MSWLKWFSSLMELSFILLVYLFQNGAPFQFSSKNELFGLTIGNEAEPRSRLIMVDGNMFFYAGKNKNITFRVSPGASIVFGETDILQLPNRTEVNMFRNQLRKSVGRMDFFEKTTTYFQRNNVEMLKMITDIRLKHFETLDRVHEINATLATRNRTNRKLKALILRLSVQIDRLLKLMRTDECVKDAPCQNGGTCIDLFGKYQCICPDHYEGQQCETRVDECAIFAGTSSGCQNNATCVNNANITGFTCQCLSGFHGHLCQQRHNSCEYSLDLCGEHGHCMPAENGYKCLCEWGYRVSSNAENPYCEDVNECIENPCFPGSSCLNLPGTYKCGSCPAGYIGNGFNCVDFDECANELTNDCSMNPKVDCINTHGSYKCGPCPPGFTGDGYKCEKILLCNAETNPCYKDAKCIEPALGEIFRCECPEGMIGNGIGEMGCQISNTTLCTNHKCLNGGICNTINSTYYECHCPFGYYGKLCEYQNNCVANPNFCGLNGQCMNVRGISVCQCDLGYYGRLCEYKEESCGFHTTNETGSIVFERSTQKRTLTAKLCTWYIQLFDTRKILRITIEKIQIPQLFEITSRSCASSVANFTIFDGPNANSPTSAVFCHGDQTLNISHPFYTSGAAATLQMSSRIQTTGTMLILSWTAVQTRCGGRLVGKSGQIDFWHGSDVDQNACVWFVQVPPQYHIEFTLNELQMASDEFVNCSVNSLEIYDNQYAMDRTRISTLCESQIGAERSVIRTSGSYAVVYFRFDRFALGEYKCKNCRIGFTISYKTIDLPDGCGGEITPNENGEFEGVIQSPNYNHPYFPNLDCLWILNASTAFAGERNTTAGSAVIEEQRQRFDQILLQDRKVMVEFVDFEVATTVTKYAPMLMFMPASHTISCSGDYVELVELDAIYCNRQPPPLLQPILHAPVLSIRFHSDDTGSARGFMLKYKTVCQRDFNSPNGTIVSPNFPNPAHRAFVCKYRIIAEPNQAIRVKFRYIGLHSDYAICQLKPERPENQDYIELSGGYSSYRAINKRYNCDFFPFVAPHGEIVTSGNRPFEITYSTSGSEHNTGFKFTYEIDDVGCGGVFTDEQKRITSPNYPESYLAHMYCIYHLSVRPNATRRALRLIFDEFDVESVGSNRDDNCEFDSVRLYNWFVDEESHGKLLGKFCGKTLPPPVLSENERMVLVFSSDRSVSGAGFSARIEPVDLTRDCDRTFNDPYGVIVFNGSEFSMDDIIKCEYRIVMPFGHRIKLTVNNLRIRCYNGQLKIWNGGSEKSPRLSRERLCGDDVNKQQFPSQGNQLFLRLESTSSEAFFNLSYELYEKGCGGQMQGYKGEFATPQYPQRDSRTFNCEWQITVAEGNRVKLDFHDMDNFDSDDYFGGCNANTRNLITVIDGPPGSENVLRHYCRHENSPTSILSSGNQLTVRYSQYGGSRQSAIYGFSAKFSTVCTDIKLSGHHGIIMAPDYKVVPYLATTYVFSACDWRITTSEGSRVRLHFHHFNIKSCTDDDSIMMIGPLMKSQNIPINLITCNSRSECAESISDTLENTSYRELINNTAKSKCYYDRFAGQNVSPFQLTAIGNIVKIKYSTFINSFWLTWTTVGCGGSVLKNGTRLRVNATADFVPANVSETRRCEWKIVAPLGYLVRVSIYEMFIAERPVENNSALLEEGVEFYSALSAASGAPVETFRGAKRNLTFISYTNELFVQLITHASTFQRQYHSEFAREGIIFDANVEFILPPLNQTFGGALIKLEPDKSVQIHSPNYPNAPPMGSHSIWQFEAPAGYTVSYRILQFANRNNWAHMNNISESCSFNQMYLNGGIIIYHGNYKRLGSYVKNTIASICESIQISREIHMKHGVSGVIFRASRHESILRSGEAPPTGALGFLMEAYCSCGGTLQATVTRQALLIRRRLETSGECEWTIEFARSETLATTRRSSEYDAYVDSDENEAKREDTNEDDRRIYVMIEDLKSHKEGSEELDIFCGGTSKGTLTKSSFKMNSAHYHRFDCEMPPMVITAHNLTKKSDFRLFYATESYFCGGEMSSERGRIGMVLDASQMSSKVECEWHVENVPGSFVSLTLIQTHFPESEYCEESFIEIRERNATGPLIGRFCRDFHREVIKRESIWIRFRYNFEANGETLYSNGPPSFEFLYWKKYGGETNSPIIVWSPDLISNEDDDDELLNQISWTINAWQSPENYIRLEFLEYAYAKIEVSEKYCTTQQPCSDKADLSEQLAEGRRVADWSRGSAFEFSMVRYNLKRVLIIRSNVATIFADKHSSFKLHWQEVSPSGYPFPSNKSSTQLTENDIALKQFACGGELEPKYELQILESPRNERGQYSNNLRCKWTIRRPILSSIILNVTSLNMEEHSKCEYDFLALSSKSYGPDDDLRGGIPEWLRICRKGQLGTRLGFSYEPETYIYMVTDSSRSFPGFSISYQLSCTVFEYFPISQGTVDFELTSPGFPNYTRPGEWCTWGITLESNREIAVHGWVEGLNSRNYLTGRCEMDFLEIGERAFHRQLQEGNSSIFCSFEAVNVTLPNGRAFITFHTSNTTTASKFKLRISEVLTECGGTGLVVHEFDPIRNIHSPNFPQMTPNSVDCSWTLGATPGRRLKFTVDPISFNLQSTEDGCDEDFLEIRDGASELSPLVGRYCGLQPPGTILSTGSYLYVRYVTDSISQSMGWNATYELESCGGVISLSAGHNATITSPNFPSLHTKDVECEWIVHAVPGHFVEAFVDYFFVFYCSQEFLEIRDGNATGTVLQERTCKRDSISTTGYRSSHNTLVVRFRGNSTLNHNSRVRYCQYQKCGFKMHFTSTKYGCGGDVTDDEGILYPPGYPTHTIPYVTCRWNFRAGIKHRYLLEFELINPNNNDQKIMNSNEKACFVNLEVWNGDEESRYVQYPTYHRFCQNDTIFVSSADIVTLQYEDDTGHGISEEPKQRLNEPALRPFHVKYTKVNTDYDNQACIYNVKKPQRIEITNLRLLIRDIWNMDMTARSSKSFCHIRINQPSQNSTVRLDFTEFRAGQLGSRYCARTQNRVIVKDDLALPYPVERTLCNASLADRGNASLAYLNPNLDVYVLNNPLAFAYSIDSIATVSFNLTITYHSCGGVLTEEESGLVGEITSPQFGFANYTDATDCVWLLRASEGKIIVLDVILLDIEYHIECANDFLEIFEGHDRMAVVHRYCGENGTENEVAERFRKIRSRGRELSLVFHSDGSVNRAGFRIAYEFANGNENGCGFHSHAPTGVVHSPNYPQDYPNGTSCIWDISVPTGFHIRLIFESLDIARSRDCQRDFLLISQEHQSRAMAPVGNYYFYFDHDEALQRVCGSDLPLPVESESNRIRLNFTTDAKGAGKGFKLRWEAVCGTVFRMNHGVITSPNYPNFYPNENFICDYLIEPETNGAPQIITLKIWDVDLDITQRLLYSESLNRKECESDYVEVRKLLSNFDKLTVCSMDGEAAVAPPALSIQGPIQVRFVVNSSLFHSTTPRIKHHRGFKLSYALADCGGELNLVDSKNRLSSVITSPGFPLPYHNKLDCKWNITAPADRIISYKFTDFDIPMAMQCLYSFVELYDGVEFPNNTNKQNRARIQHYCGTAFEGQRTTSSNNLQVRFVTSTYSIDNTHRGFRLVVTATLGPLSGCGGELAAGVDWQTLTPPINASNNNKYYSDLRCEWTIRTLEPRKILELRFTQLDMEVKREQAQAQMALDALTSTASPIADVLPADWRSIRNSSDENLQSCYDFVAIYDGPKSMSPFLLRPTCAPPDEDNMPISLYSSHQKVVVYFESDSFDEFRGFSMNYRAIDNDCGGKFLASSVPAKLNYESERTVTRTNQRHKRCRFYFYSDEQQPLEITFKSFSFPSRTSDCGEEYAELRDVGVPSDCKHPACSLVQLNTAGAVWHTCGNVPPPRFISRTSVVQLTTSVVLQSQYSAKFELEYVVLNACNRSIDLKPPMESGRITSPNYPRYYSNNDTCITYLSAPHDRRILLVFRDFRMERGYDYSSLLRFIPAWRRDSRRQAAFYFRLKYPYGRDNNKLLNMAPYIDETRLGNAICVYDMLNVYFNSSNPAQNQTFCGFTLPPSIISTRNQMTVQLRTDESMSYDGYDAFYYTVTTSTIGKQTDQGPKTISVYDLGTIHERIGVLTHFSDSLAMNENMANASASAYPPNSMIRLTILPPLGMQCTLELKPFDMSVGNENCGDYLTLKRIYVDVAARTLTNDKDSNIDDETIRLPCKLVTGTKFPLPMGDANALSVSFHADESTENDGTGFRMEWKCEDLKTVQF